MRRFPVVSRLGVPAGVVTLSKPTNRPTLSQTLRVLCAIRERLRGLRQRQATVEEKMEELRLVNRAKWLLIAHQHLTEPEAHRSIVQQAMEGRTTKRAVAERIIGQYS